MPRVTLALGDLTLEDVDAIVNAANPRLLGGGGVDGAIHRRGRAADPRRVQGDPADDATPTACPPAQAVATTGGKLRARWVIHTVGPRYFEHDDPAPLLARCHTEALRVADELGARTVAFPAISTGVYGYPVEEAAPVAVAAVLGARTRAEEVRFVLFDPRRVRGVPLRPRDDGAAVAQAVGSISCAMTELSHPNGVWARRVEVQIVDCRETYEWVAGRIEGAVHIPLNGILAGSIGDLDPGKPVVVVCRSGNRSELGTLMLQARGFDAHNLEGGMEEWEREGLPFSTPDGAPGRVA